MPWARSFLGFQPASTNTKVPAKRCFLLFTLPKACYTRSVCLSPRSCSISWHSFSPWHNLSKLSSAHGLPKELFIVVYVVFVVFFLSSRIGRGRGREGIPFVWRISFSRRRGRVARWKPLGLVLLPYAGRVAGSATGADVAARAVATSRRSAARWAVRPCRTAPWISRPACRRPGLRRYPGLRRPWWPS